MLSHEEVQRRRVAGNRSRGKQPPSGATASRQLDPLAHYEDDSLEICYHPKLERMLLDC